MNSNHSSQIIDWLPKIISDSLSRNSSNEKMFNGKYKHALKHSGYSNISLLSQ